LGVSFPFSSRRFIQSCDPSEVDGQTCTGMYAHIHTKRSVTEPPHWAPTVCIIGTRLETHDLPWAANLFLVVRGDPACGGDSRDVFVDVRSWINVSVILIPFWSN
jgi:hypothetical protein